MDGFEETYLGLHYQELAIKQAHEKVMKQRNDHMADCDKFINELISAGRNIGRPALPFKKRHLDDAEAVCWPFIFADMKFQTRVIFFILKGHHTALMRMQLFRETGMTENQMLLYFSGCAHVGDPDVARPTPEMAKDIYSNYAVSVFSRFETDEWTPECNWSISVSYGEPWFDRATMLPATVI
jgi:hypothetical protein